MSAGNFASLTAGLLVRKGEAEPSPVMPAEVFPFPLRVVQAPVDAPVPAGPTPQRKRRELAAESTGADVGAYTGADAPAKPRQMVVQLSANEYDALDLVALKAAPRRSNCCARCSTTFSLYSSRSPSDYAALECAPG